MEDRIDPSTRGANPIQMQLVIQFSGFERVPTHRALILGGKLGQYVRRIRSGEDHLIADLVLLSPPLFIHYTLHLLLCYGEVGLCIN